MHVAIYGKISYVILRMQPNTHSCDWKSHWTQWGLFLRGEEHIIRLLDIFWMYRNMLKKKTCINWVISWALTFRICFPHVSKFCCTYKAPCLPGFSVPSWGFRIPCFGEFLHATGQRDKSHHNWTFRAYFWFWAYIWSGAAFRFFGKTPWFEAKFIIEFCPRTRASPQMEVGPKLEVGPKMTNNSGLLEGCWKTPPTKSAWQPYCSQTAFTSIGWTKSCTYMKSCMCRLLPSYGNNSTYKCINGHTRLWIREKNFT